MPIARFKINPTQTALPVIVMQQVFLYRDSLMPRPRGRDLIPGLNRPFEVCHRQGVTVFFPRHALKRDLSDVGFYPEFLSGRPKRYLFLKSNPDADIAPEMVLGIHDIIVAKNAYSALVGTNLEAIPDAAGIGTLVIGGVDMHVCCEATARDARHRNQRVIFRAGRRFGYHHGKRDAAPRTTRMDSDNAKITTIGDFIGHLKTEQKRVRTGGIQAIEGFGRSKFKRPVCQFIGSARHMGKAWAITAKDLFCYSEHFSNIADSDTICEISVKLFREVYSN